MILGIWENYKKRKQAKINAARELVADATGKLMLEITRVKVLPNMREMEKRLDTLCEFAKKNHYTKKEVSRLRFNVNNIISLQTKSLLSREILECSNKK